MPSDCLISVIPDKTLVFQVETDTQSKTTLKITNTSTSKVVFKVKTTQPTWYYVRPNQQVLDVGCSEDVDIFLTDEERSRFLLEATSDPARRLEKHRFMVQSIAITDSDYASTISIPPAKRADQYSKLWETYSVDKRKSMTLKVEFLYPGASAYTSLGSAPENIENIRSHIGGTAKSNPSQNSVDDGIPEDSSTGLRKLRSKYDTVVEYTVRLTAERDLLRQRLEGADKELLLTRKKANQADTAGTNDRIVEKKDYLAGFSLHVLIAVVVLSFLFGRYFSI